MDHKGARFVVSALESRLNGDRAELDRLAANDVLCLEAAASRLKCLGAGWPCAKLAGEELERIARLGGEILDRRQPPETLKFFVDKFRAILAELDPKRKRAKRARNDRDTDPVPSFYL